MKVYFSVKFPMRDFFYGSNTAATQITTATVAATTDDTDDHDTAGTLTGSVSTMERCDSWEFLPDDIQNQRNNGSFNQQDSSSGGMLVIRKNKNSSQSVNGKCERANRLPVQVITKVSFEDTHL